MDALPRIACLTAERDSLQQSVRKLEHRITELNQELRDVGLEHDNLLEETVEIADILEIDTKGDYDLVVSVRQCKAERDVAVRRQAVLHWLQDVLWIEVAGKYHMKIADMLAGQVRVWTFSDTAPSVVGSGITPADAVTVIRLALAKNGLVVPRHPTIEKDL